MPRAIVGNWMLLDPKRKDKVDEEEEEKELLPIVNY